MKIGFRKTAAIIFAVTTMVAASNNPASAQCGKASWYALTSKTASGEQHTSASRPKRDRAIDSGGNDAGGPAAGEIDELGPA